MPRAVTAAWRGKTHCEVHHVLVLGQVSDQPEWLYQISYGLASYRKLRVLFETERHAIVHSPGERWWDNSGGHYGGVAFYLVDKGAIATYRRGVGLLDTKELQVGGRAKLAQWKTLIKEIENGNSEGQQSGRQAVTLQP